MSTIQTSEPFVGPGGSSRRRPIKMIHDFKATTSFAAHHASFQLIASSWILHNIGIDRHPDSESVNRTALGR